jgi:carboxylesterase type B
VRFLFIPFAEPTVRPSRWLTPSTKSLEASINANEFSSSCPQYRPLHYPFTTPTRGPLSFPDLKTEDCLKLNTWVLARTKKCGNENPPVLLWIYRRSFQTGWDQTEYQVLP